MSQVTAASLSCSKLSKVLLVYSGSGDRVKTSSFFQVFTNLCLLFLICVHCMRLVDIGKVFERGSPEFDRLMSEGDSELGFPTPQMLPGARAIIWLDIT